MLTITPGTPAGTVSVYLRPSPTSSEIDSFSRTRAKAPAPLAARTSISVVVELLPLYSSGSKRRSSSVISAVAVKTPTDAGVDATTSNGWEAPGAMAPAGHVIVVPDPEHAAVESASS
jgi:hypothetical protein